jgi:CRP-like cAMP-binding protein
MKSPAPHCHSCAYRHASLFKNCGIAEMDSISENKCFNTYKKGQVIFHEGNRPFGIFCVFKGKVKVSRLSADGKEHIVRLARSGDVLGYRSLIENAKYSASAIALDDTEACFVSGTDFNRLVDENVKVANDLLKMLARALGETQEKFTHLAMKPVRERLAEALILLKKTYEQEGQTPFSIAISREDLAALVGTAKETVIRFLSEFKEEGIVSTQGSTITLLRPEQLVRISSLYD